MHAVILFHPLPIPAEPTPADQQPCRQGYFFLNLCTPNLAQVFKEAFSWHNFSRWPTGSWKKGKIWWSKKTARHFWIWNVSNEHIYIVLSFMFQNRVDPWHNQSIPVLMIHWMCYFDYPLVSNACIYIYIYFFFFFGRFRESNSKEFVHLDWGWCRQPVELDITKQ